MISPSASITSLNTSLREFFFHWVMFTRPMHNLTLKESEVLAALLYKRYQLSKAIINEVILNNFLFSKETKDAIMKESSIKSSDFSNALSRLRKKDVITAGNLINHKFVPNLKFDSQRFDFLIMFNITDNNDDITHISLDDAVSVTKQVVVKPDKVETPVETKPLSQIDDTQQDSEILEQPLDYEEKMRRMFSQVPQGEADLSRVGYMERRKDD